MGTPSQIRDALAAHIDAAIPGLRGLTDPGSIANPPVAVVLPGQGTYIDYTVALEHGVYDISIRVVVLVSRASERTGMELLDGYLAPAGASSVAAAILADETLGGVTDYCIPQEATFPGTISWSGVDYFGAEIICTAAAE